MSETAHKAYPSDLTDAQWEITAPLPPPKAGPEKTEKSTCEKSSMKYCTF